MFWCSGGSQSNEVHWIHLDFLSGYHLHLMPPELVTKIIFVNLCSIQFHHIFISFLLLQISRPSHSSGMLFQSSVLTLPPTILFKIILRHIKFINGCTKQGLCLRNSIVTSPQSNSFLSRSARLSPFSPQLIPISSSFNNYPSVSLDHFTEAQRNTSKELYLSEVYQRKGWVNLWSFIFIAFTHFPFTLNLLFKNCFDKSFMKVLFSPQKSFHLQKRTWSPHFAFVWHSPGFPCTINSISEIQNSKAWVITTDFRKRRCKSVMDTNTQMTFCCFL